ncbi:hypothetical protein [Pseudobacteroides cellulosolvens]|uniref:Uncharacterized protein n=1 Tax=Pseudobacteroides cellulosolvens ATCC 35603 = DSM 2933 TaxID=398512 RepID=A0A0L6JYI5_9FIRM|nr:hypothetical protein [Pseudobacteroides cellulosolvens]KNY30585.1 hypothetical protein Bccel_5865 [Pseudobacteroides cellulosolvens ATCC 35603 = DSM 2933]
MTYNNNKKPIKDNPSTKKLKEEMDSMNSLITFGKFLGVFKKEEFKELSGLRNQLEILTTLPDDFNGFFSKHGWIAYEGFNVEVMKKAIEYAKQGKFKEAEEEILNYYIEDNIRFIISRGASIEAFRARRQLSLNALDEYVEKHYYACVPLLLMVIDGLVNDISKETGFFAEKTDLTSWDSIAGHYSGLTALKQIFNSSRKKTNTEQITMPYRNGIMHGRDLNFDNIYVAAKCWCCLAAVLDWGRDIMNGKKTAPEPQPKKTFMQQLGDLKDSFDKLEQSNKFKDRIKNWKPRSLVIESNQYKNINSSKLQAFSPEKFAVEFLEYWQMRNYGYMAKYAYLPIKSKQNSQVAREMRIIFKNKELINYEITSINDEAPAITQIGISLEIYYQGIQLKKQTVFRMLIQGDNVINGDNDVQWVIVSGYQLIEYLKLD